ncbi:MAG: tRNA-dihydrouridine synthase family protein [Prevotella sp.]|nr:tRNA-dihydrouridine synthase family protein [Bacteroides sp.]MCM1365634.1 tRNA-dihydrouridine synthase family protein [Prevotella sp.]
MSFFLYAAPMQGHTDAPFRHFHAKIYGEADAYFTPFIRIERGEIRRRDIRDLYSDLNDNHFLIPQIIFNDLNEFNILLEQVMDSGAREVDLNLGCPYPMQTNHGRGAAMISNLPIMKEISSIINDNDEISFSIKMRMGLNYSDEWVKLLPIINNTRLAHVTFHPRMAKQKYDGELDLRAFEEFLKICDHPVIFNGDIFSPSQILELKDKYPQLAGVMCGRGLLGRPSLFAEVTDGFEWQKDKRIDTMMKFHDTLKRYYSEKLCGDSQLVSRMKNFWEYAEAEIGRKQWKSVHKAVTIAKYDLAVNAI